MGKIKISEQDIINALCLYIANKKQISPHEVEIQLLFDDEHGFSAESYVFDRKQILITLNIIEAIRLWLDTEMGGDPFAAGIELVLDDKEGIIAIVNM